MQRFGKRLVLDCAELILHPGEVDGLVFLHGGSGVGEMVTARVVQALDYDLVAVVEGA